MQVLYERCAGLDVHKKTVVACVLLSADSTEIGTETGTEPGQLRKEVRAFGTMTDNLLELSDWLSGFGVSHVAMESTGVYWKPIWNLLEGTFALLLVNAQHIKAVPGRKTDVKDAEWLAELLRHGLLRASFVPDRPQRELRELTRYRTSLVREKAAEANRLAKTLEGANIKLGSVASDITGVSARAMIAGLIAGQADPEKLAELARGKLRDKLPQLEQALKGQVNAHQRFLLARQLEHLDFLEETIGTVSREVAERLRPFDEDLGRLDAIPGVGRRVAEVLKAELGNDMARFPTAGHAAAWAGLAPGNDESAGKRRSGKTRKGSPALRATLVEAAQAAARTDGTFLAAQYHRIAARRGHKRAIIAVAHSILIIAYRMLSEHVAYRELGSSFYDQRDRQSLERRLINRLERLGNKVTVEPIAAGAA